MTSPGRAVAETTQESIIWRTPLVTMPWTPDLDMARIMIANAISIISVEAGDTETRPILEDLLGPVRGRWDLDRPFGARRDATGRYVTQGVSTCGLVATGLWRRAGVDADWLHQPYVPGTAVSRIVAHAIKTRAWSGLRRDVPPPPGATVVIGRGLLTHVLTVVRVSGDDDVIVESVDGGQVGRGGLQAVRLCRRRWLAGLLDGRAIQGWVDPMLLPYMGDVMVPAGWDAYAISYIASSNRAAAPILSVGATPSDVDRTTSPPSRVSHASSSRWS